MATKTITKSQLEKLLADAAELAELKAAQKKSKTRTTRYAIMQDDDDEEFDSVPVRKAKVKKKVNDFIASRIAHHKAANDALPGPHRKKAQRWAQMDPEFNSEKSQRKWDRAVAYDNWSTIYNMVTAGSARSLLNA